MYLELVVSTVSVHRQLGPLLWLKVRLKVTEESSWEQGTRESSAQQGQNIYLKGTPPGTRLLHPASLLLANTQLILSGGQCTDELRLSQSTNHFTPKPPGLSHM